MIALSHSQNLCRSPGFGITLVAETTNGAFLTAEACSNPKGSTEPPSVPEDIGKEAANLLLEEIYRVCCKVRMVNWQGVFRVGGKVRMVDWQEIYRVCCKIRMEDLEEIGRVFCTRSAELWLLGWYW